MAQRNGLWEEIQAQICLIARRLKVKISGCKDMANSPIQVIRGSDYSYEEQYPTTMATEPKDI
jgi:hypothetical protein